MVACGGPAEIKKCNATINIYSVLHCYQRKVTLKRPSVHFEAFSGIPQWNWCGIWHFLWSSKERILWIFMAICISCLVLGLGGWPQSCSHSVSPSSGEAGVGNEHWGWSHCSEELIGLGAWPWWWLAFSSTLETHFSHPHTSHSASESEQSGELSAR